MNLFGWILAFGCATMALVAWSYRNETPDPKNNAVAFVLLVSIVIGILTVGTGEGLL